MSRFFKTILLLFFFNSANAEIITSIDITGNKRVSEETIKVYGDIELNKNYEDQDLNEILKKLYSTNFFEDIKISIANNSLKINLKEFRVINSIIIEGEPSNKFKEEIIKRILSKEKDSFIENNVVEDEIIIKKIYQSLGYNFVEVDSKFEEFGGERLNLYFIINRQDKTKISEINFIGDKKIRDSKLRDLIVSEEYKFWKFISQNIYLSQDRIELDKRLLVNFYKSLGYYDIQVISNFAEISKNNETILTYNINAGTRYKISKINTNLDQSLDKNPFVDLQNVYEEFIGKYYSPFSVKKILDEIDEVITDNDLQFVQHSVSENLSADNIEITFNIFEGPRIMVERLNIDGNRITNEDVIRSEMLIDEGDPFNRTSLAKSISRLRARNIFAKVEETIEEGSSKDLRVVNITVEEKATGEISAGAGIGTDGGAFEFSIKENNWLGKGLQVDSFIALNADSAKGGIQIKDPNYKFSGNERFYNISSTTNDQPNSGYENSIIELGIGTRYEQYKNLFFSPSLSLTSDKLDVDTTASTNLKKQEGTFNDMVFNYDITFDERDRPYLPSDGFISGFGQTLPIAADAPYIRNTFYRNNYNSIGNDIITAMKFYVSTVHGVGEDVRLSKRVKLPATKIRGFESGKIGPKDNADFIGGNYAASLNLEASLPNLFPESTNLDLNLFLDFANVWGVDYDSSIDESNKLRASTGVAFDWTSPIGPMSFIFAQDLAKADTDKTETFNFRLGTTF